VFADFGDRVTLAPAERLTLSVSGPFAAHAPGDQRDLSWRAAEAFFAHSGLPPRAAIHVEKNIPAGAGLGGGSADAAAVLRGLNRMFGTGLPHEDLARVGLRLGADVPMCLVGRALLARGIGEEIDVLEGWPSLPVVLVWPGEAVSTAAVFQALPRRENPGLSVSGGDPAEWLGRCRNDLQIPAEQIAPSMRSAVKALRASRGCLLARMSGSGSACFGLFRDDREAAAATGSLRKGWWVRAGRAH
jgi:4-diphosphocytidyl-2-C-methyl-D-erythritol kinase